MFYWQNILCTSQKTTTSSNKDITLNTKISRSKILELHVIKNDIYRSSPMKFECFIAQTIFFIKYHLTSGHK